MSIRLAQSHEIALRATKPNAGIREAYYKKLRALIDKMSRDVEREIKAVYADYEPLIAQDAALPSKKLSKSLEALKKDWDSRFKTSSDEIAEWFAKKANSHVGRSKKAAARAGMELNPDIKVRFSTGNASKDVLESIVSENTNLISSLGNRYFTDITGDVMRSVQNGRDLKDLAKTLSKRYDITRRRAQLIARDQNNKATEALSRANDKDAGVTHGIWIHVAGRKSSRETHKKMDGKKFDLSKGLYDSDVGKYVLPAELVACNCTYRPIFTDKI